MYGRIFSIQPSFRFAAINHPDYNPVNLNFDISIIPIPSHLTLSHAIQTIRLPTSGQVGSNFIDYQAVVSGWGATGAGTIEAELKE